MPGRPFRAVLDPNVLVSARISPGGTPAGLLQAAEDGRYELIVSGQVIEEVREVLSRPKMRRYFEEGAIPVYLDRLREAATVGNDPPGAVTRGFTSDPDDDYLVGLTALAGASYLVSGDSHLIGLPDRAVKDAEGRVLARVVTPREFLDELR